MQVKTLTVGQLFTNCYLVACPHTRQAAIIDPGDEAHRILSAARAAQWRITHILLTHAHFDHIGAASALADATAAPLFLHPDDKLLFDVGGGAMLFDFPSPEVPQKVELLTEGQQFLIGQLTLRVLHTPGHSPGSVCFYAAEHQTIFVGDVLFANGIGRTDLPGGDYTTLMRSIRRLMELPDDTTVYPGHGPATTIGRERTENVWLSQDDWS